MYHRCRLLALALALGCAEYVVGQTPPGDQRASFTMRAAMPHGTVRPGAEVWVVISLWHARSGRAPYTVHVLDQAAKPVPLRALERVFRGEAAPQEKGKPMRIRTGSGYSMKIAPGETAKDEIVIQDQVDLSQPGEYTIQLERVDPATKVLVKSNKVTLTVVSDPPPPK